MPTVEIKDRFEDGVSNLITITVDEKTDLTTLNIVRTLTTGRGLDKVTAIVADRTWRRAPRGSADPVWELQAKDGTFQPVVDRDLVDEEVRLAWVRFAKPIKKKEGRVKLAKTYVDTTDYNVWREKLRQVNHQLVN